MCGIFGLADFHDGGTLCGVDGRAAVMDAMGQALFHRGPDDEGTFISCDPGPTVALGIRRLSIIDVEGGHQPIANEDETIILVCNGEIYNYRELRDAMRLKGHVFRTGSDSEVIVHLYEEFGWECVSQLRGMFAFALWDRREQKMLVARDRMGIKPLFFRHQSGRLVFASEVRGLLPVFDEAPDVRPEMFLRLLRLQYVAAPETVFEGIQKLLPGHVLLEDVHGMELRQYWTLPSCREETRSQNGELPREVLARLTDAVQRHLVSDVPVGAFLSGGLDSSAVVALMHRAGVRRVSTFSVGFDGPPQHSELFYARMAAEEYGTAHHELVVTPQNVIDALPDIIRHLDEPLADSAIVPTYLLSKHAGQSVKVVLTGEGADELFGGYRRYRLNALARWVQFMPSALRSWILHRLRHRSFDRRVLQGFGALSEVSPSRRHINWAGTFTQDELCELAYDPLHAADEERRLDRVFQPYFTSDQAGDGLAGMLRADLSTWLPDDLLAKIDRMSMAASIEARVPYLDHPLVEFVAQVPTALKVGNGLKMLLRTAMMGIVPSAIIHRKKMGFEMPLASWIRGPLRGFVGDTLRQEGPPGLFNERTVERFLSEHLKGEQDRGRQLWGVLVVKLWYRAVVHDSIPVACS